MIDRSSLDRSAAIEVAQAYLQGWNDHDGVAMYGPGVSHSVTGQPTIDVNTT
jgi:hypothetical protein